MTNAGPIIEPMAITVAGLEPLIAAKKTHAKTALMPMPPGIQPTHARAKPMRRVLISPRAMTDPLMMKSGTAISVF